MRNFKERSDEQEIMDDLDCNGEVVDQTLRELDVINRRLGGNQISVQGLKKLVKEADKERQLVIADLGCGGGDILIVMAKWAKKNDIKIKFIGIDANPNIISYAERHCKDYPEISFKSLNIFSEEFKKMKFDIIHSSLFTHHFKENELVNLFTQLKQQVRLGIIINDLHRHWLAYYSIKMITSLFSKSAMVRNDAAVSVARGFVRKDIHSFLEKSNLANYKIAWKWAFRWRILIES